MASPAAGGTGAAANGGRLMTAAAPRRQLLPRPAAGARLPAAADGHRTAQEEHKPSAPVARPRERLEERGQDIGITMPSEVLRKRDRS